MVHNTVEAQVSRANYAAATQAFETLGILYLLVDPELKEVLIFSDEDGRDSQAEQTGLISHVALEEGDLEECAESGFSCVFFE